MTELDDAVNALTEPVTYEHDINGRTMTVQLESRLDQLDGAITNTLRTAGTSRAAKNERSVLNSEALERFRAIEMRIREWCWDEAIQPAGDATTNLRAWRDNNPRHDERHLTRMLEWATMIDAQFQPLRTAPIINACPVCTATTWVDENGETHLHPLERSYIEGELLTTAKALCKACKTVWEGVEAVAELGEEINA